VEEILDEGDEIVLILVEEIVAEGEQGINI
jgi:hypothetical protein